MDDISYRLIEKMTDGNPVVKQDMWLYFRNTQIVPGASNVLFDASFQNSIDFGLIAKDLPLSTKRNDDVYKITEHGVLGYKKEKESRKKPLRDRYRFWYDLVLILIGAAISLGGAILQSQLEKKEPILRVLQIEKRLEALGDSVHKHQIRLDSLK